MNPELKLAFSRIKPVCDMVMLCPTPDKITAFIAKLSEMKVEAVQELQQYILFPFITHIKSEEIEKKFELLSSMADAMKQVLDRVTVTSFEMCMKIENALLSVVFDNSKPGMVAEVPEELKLSVMRCLTTLMLRLDQHCRMTMLKTQVPTIAQAVFVAVHIAKLDKLRQLRFRSLLMTLMLLLDQHCHMTMLKTQVPTIAQAVFVTVHIAKLDKLRLTAIDCLTAHTCSHRLITNAKGHITEKHLELLVVDTLSNILPGVLAALQDVVTDVNNPGHAVVVAALEATHRILCLTMHDKHKPRAPDLTAHDFAKLVIEKAPNDRQVSKEKKPKFLAKRSLEWYEMAGDKITVVTQSLATLTSHEHPKVRKELAVLCYRILDECNTTMQPSLPIALDVLISLSKDDFPEVSEYCTNAVRTYMDSNTERNKTVDGLVDNFFNILTSLPRILNNIDSTRKLSTLNLLHGYITILCDGSRPQRLTTAISQHRRMSCCCDALLAAAATTPLTSLAQHSTRDVLSPPPTTSPWCKLRHLDTPACEDRLRAILRLLGNAECAELIADRLLELFHQERSSEIVYMINWMASAENSPLNLVRRVLNTYIEEDVWYLPLAVGNNEAPLTTDDTLDASVYNPRAWLKDSVPDLYEGAVETRYTDITYLVPRTMPHRDPNTCATLAEAQKNMVLACLLTEGVGIMATRLKEEYQPFLLKTLCLVLERVGSKYEMLHLAGLKAINDIALACGHQSVAELIRDNADYFTNQVTVRLKKAWNSQSALQILSVVMEYSDSSILDCLYGIVEDVLVQSCDKYYEKNLDSYLQVFLTFIQCIHKWFPPEIKDPENQKPNQDIDVFKDVLEFIKNEEETERLMNTDEFDQESGKTVEEMYNEDMKQREEDILDYDDRVTNEKPPLPQHIRVTETIIKRCINFVTSPRRHESLLALQVLNTGLPILKEYEDELLPLVHQCWSPLVAKFEAPEPVALRRALDLLVTMAELSKDFIRSRTVKEVLPHMYKYLQKSALDSYLKDAGSAYRNSHAYRLQEAALKALPKLAVDLVLDDEKLNEAMACASLYLSNKQPKPLQALAVTFFKSVLDYDYGATWHYLRKVCDNKLVLNPPKAAIHLEPIVGTPFESTNKDNDHNIKLIWDLV